MEKIILLKNLISNLDATCLIGHELNKYIGTGNPLANILIIGKESGHEVGTKGYSLSRFFIGKPRTVCPDIHRDKS